MSFKDKLLSFLIYIIVTLYARTWRYKPHNKSVYDNEYKSGRSPVVAVWHDQLFMTSFHHRGENVVTIASDSKDGSLITELLNKWRFRVARGSSTRDGLKAALGAIKLAKTALKPVAITVDGPKGPRHIVKEGALFIAKKLDKKIVIAVASPKRYKRFNSWDRFILPLPFTRIDIYYSDIFELSGDEDEATMKKEAALIQQKMLEFTDVHSPNII